MMRKLSLWIIVFISLIAHGARADNYFVTWKDLNKILYQMHQQGLIDYAIFPDGPVLRNGLPADQIVLFSKNGVGRNQFLLTQGGTELSQGYLFEEGTVRNALVIVLGDATKANRSTVKC